jgi:sulfite reductase (NADPH) hemoprotein beta-component
LRLSAQDIARITKAFAPPVYEDLEDPVEKRVADRMRNPRFAKWLDSNVDVHKQPGYSIVTVSLKRPGGVPGDLDTAQMEKIAAIADHFGFGEVRVTQKQNLVLPDIRTRDLYAVWLELDDIALGAGNAGLLSDIVACPGLDYCNLANARSVPVAQRVSALFSDLERQHEIGPITLHISGCINACAQHHTANIGVLGVDKKGTEHYQITLGGRADGNDAIGRIVGPAFTAEEIESAIAAIIDVYLSRRLNGERFVDAVSRLGLDPFREKLYEGA